MPSITVTIQAEGKDPEAYDISAETVASLDKMAATQVTMQPIEVPLPNGTVFKTMAPVTQCSDGKELIVHQLRYILIPQALTLFPTDALLEAQKAVDEAATKRDELRKTDMIAPVSALTPALPVALPAPTAQVKT